MLVIRFQRVGRTNDPAFKIVVTEKRSKPKSGELEILGSYHPKTKATAFKSERILYWMSKGAKASPTVHNLLVSKDVIKDKKINIKIPKVEISAENIAKTKPDLGEAKPVPVEVSEGEERAEKAEAAVSTAMEGEKDTVASPVTA